jgi:hypothetical protein
VTAVSVTVTSGVTVTVITVRATVTVTVSVMGMVFFSVNVFQDGLQRVALTQRLNPRRYQTRPIYITLTTGTTSNVKLQA